MMVGPEAERAYASSAVRMIDAAVPSAISECRGDMDFDGADLVRLVPTTSAAFRPREANLLLSCDLLQPFRESLCSMPVILV